MKKIIVSSVIMTLIFLAAGGWAAKELIDSRQEVKDLKYELAHSSQYVPLEHDTVMTYMHDTVEVAASPVIMASLKALRKQHVIDKQMIKDLRLQVKQLETMQTTVLETRDTVAAKADAGDSLYYYNDQWADLKFSLADTTFYYNIRDSLSTIVYREYKHKFLWWRWGTKGYRLKIINYNPKAHIIYNRYVKAER